MSSMYVASRLANRRLYSVTAGVVPVLSEGRSRISNSVAVKFRVETKRSAAGQGESQAYTFNLDLDDARTLRDRLNTAIAVTEAN